MYGFVTSIVIGALLTSIGFWQNSRFLLILVLVATCLAFITHMGDLPSSVRTSAWFLGLAIGILAVANAIYVLL